MTTFYDFIIIISECRGDVCMKWPETISIEQARELQKELRKRVRVIPLTREPRYVAGVDAAFSEDLVYAAACLYRYPELTLVEKTCAVEKLRFPYVPGFLSFREGHAVIAAIRKLPTKPDIILVDGQGIAHPRGIGIASHLGVLLDISTIGCAKTGLVGEFKEPGGRKGDWSRLAHEGRIVGAVLRTKDGVRPLFVSPGHKIDLDAAVRITLDCIGRYRIPEPLRCADMLSKKSRSGPPP
jgi:deoxyribonuclease V